MDSPAWQETPSGCFKNLAISYVHLRLYQPRVSIQFQQNGKSDQSLEIVYPRQKCVQFEPHSRQCALMSDFLDFAKLSIQEEAVSATNGIKDRPEGLKPQNLAMATLTGPSLRSQPKNKTADVQYAINKCESLGSGKHLVLHRNPLAIAKDFSHIWPLFDIMFV